jgi:hypothetical protein
VDGRRDVCGDVDPIIGVDGVRGCVVRHGWNPFEVFEGLKWRGLRLHKDWSVECKQTEELQNDKHALWVVIGGLAIYTINVEHRHGVIGLFDAGDAPPIGPLGVLLLSEQQGYLNKML